jgi:hypothetical protein
MIPLLLACLAQEAVAAPALSAPDVRFDLSLWCNPTCDEEALERFDQALSSVPLAEELPITATSPTRVAGLAPAEGYGRPDPDLAQALPGDLDPAGAQVVAKSEVVVVTGFAAPATQALPLIRQVYGAFATLSRETGGVVEEVSTGRYYSAAAFDTHAKAVATDPFDATLLFVVETQEDGAGAFALSTWGLGAFGLPELHTTAVPAQSLDDMTAVLDTLIQVAVERGGLSEATPLSEYAASLPAARGRAVGIEGTARVSMPATRDDPEVSPKALMTFEGRFDAPPLGARLEDAPGTAPPATLPSPDRLTPVAQPPSTLEEARAEATLQLAGPVRAAFAAGLPPGDVLFVKAPFDADQGRVEYLWLTVQSWEGGSLEGTLRSQPTWIVDLAPGDPVRVLESAVYDFLLKHADGTSVGNGTEPFLSPGP